MLKIRQLIWDSWNVEHIKNKVEVIEVEDICHSPIRSFKTYNKRLVILGGNKKGRLLTIILASKSPGKYYVVTARDASKKERRLIK